MKKAIFTIIVLLTNFLAFGQVENPAQKTIQKYLDILQAYHSNPNSSKSSDRANIVHFLTQLTGIPSKSDGDYSGQSNPAKEDLINWSFWYNVNRQNIFWDDEKKEIILKKNAVPPILLQGY